MCDAPVLSYFDKTCHTQVIADASPYVLAAVLVQKQNGQNCIKAYASRTLSQIERKYSQTEKEAIALVWSCERFHVYLYGVDFDLLTDHKALEFIFSPRSKPSARIERWIIHIAGSKNIADSLSRLFNEKVIKNAQNDDNIDKYVKLIVKYATPIALIIIIIITTFLYTPLTPKSLKGNLYDLGAVFLNSKNKHTYTKN